MLQPYEQIPHDDARVTSAPPGEGDRRAPRLRVTGERGEGVISTAIAVWIMAFIGAAMWAVFNGVFTEAGATIEQQVSEIGG